ncbi:hypothetical protein ACJJTC_013085 [Scirpophaga incertulas]
MKFPLAHLDSPQLGVPQGLQPSWPGGRNLCRLLGNVGKGVGLGPSSVVKGRPGGREWPPVGTPVVGYRLKIPPRRGVHPPQERGLEGFGSNGPKKQEQDALVLGTGGGGVGPGPTLQTKPGLFYPAFGGGPPGAGNV